MYSWDSRSDCIGIDEPLYRDWMKDREDRSDIHRPYKNELLHGSKVCEMMPKEKSFKWDREQKSLFTRVNLALEKDDRHNPIKVIFCKHMGHHRTLFDFDKNKQISDEEPNSYSVAKHFHILLIRDPVAILNSWNSTSSVHLSADAKPDEVGLLPLLSIYSDLVSHGNKNDPIIVDSDELANNPSHVLQTLCSKLELPFSEKMLFWPAGPKECDGAWASYWYENVHKSSGWSQNLSDSCIQASYKTFDLSLMPQMRMNLPIYLQLQSLSVTQQMLQEKVTNEDLEDSRNANLFCWIGPPKKYGGGQLYPREMARISPFDSAVQGGDAVWEGLRIYNGKILTLEEHLTRLFQSSRAMGFKNEHTKEEVKDAIFATLG